MESRQTKIWTQLGRWTDKTDRQTKIWTQQKPDQKIGTNRQTNKNMDKQTKIWKKQIPDN